MLVDAERVGGVRHVDIHDAEIALRARQRGFQQASWYKRLMYAVVKEGTEARVDSRNQAAFTIIVEHARTETMLPEAVNEVEKLRILRLTMRLLRTDNVVSLAVVNEARVPLGRL